MIFNTEERVLEKSYSLMLLLTFDIFNLTHYIKKNLLFQSYKLFCAKTILALKILKKSVSTI